MKLHATVTGEGQAFLILHGFLGMGDNWKTLSNSFSETGYQAHLIDQRNHGRSPHSDIFNYTELAKDVKEYIEDNSLKNVILMGHSMGGKTAMQAAALFPHLVEKLIVVDIAPKYYPPHHQQILEGMAAVNEAKIGSRQEADALLAKYVPEKAVRMFLLKNLYWKNKSELSLRLNLEVLTREIEAVGEGLDISAHFNGPTLFIKGARSNYIAAEDESLLKKHFPNAKIAEVEGAGHWVHAEKREIFYDTVIEFLASTD